MRRIRQWVTIGHCAAALLLGGCESLTAPPIARERLATMKTVAVVSLLTDQVSGSRPEGIMQAFPPAAPVDWRTNDAIRNAAADTLKGRGLTFADLAYQPPQPSPGTVQQHQTAMAQQIAQALAQAAGATPLDLVVVIHPVALNRYGNTRAVSAVGAVLTFSVLGVVSAATEEFRPGYLVLLPTSFEQAMGTARACSIGYNLYVVNAHTGEILGQTQDVVARSDLDRAIWPSDYVSLPEADRQALRNNCLSGLLRSLADNLSRMISAQ